MANREREVSECALEISLKNGLNQTTIANQCYLILDEKFDVRSVTENQI